MNARYPFNGECQKFKPVQMLWSSSLSQLRRCSLSCAKTSHTQSHLQIYPHILDCEHKHQAKGSRFNFEKKVDWDSWESLDLDPLSWTSHCQNISVPSRNNFLSIPFTCHDRLTVFKDASIWVQMIVRKFFLLKWHRACSDDLKKICVLPSIEISRASALL